MFTPKVSIIIPVYNGEKYVSEAIDSALNQTYKNLEIIVINDGSSDNTDNICKTYGKKILYFCKENGGVSSALNLGIKKMSGEYFSWLSHDDKYLPTKVENQIKLIKQNKNAIIFSNYYLINHKGKIISKCNFQNVYSKITKEQIPYFALYSNWIGGCSLLINKSLFDKYGLFDEKYRYTQDYRKWFEFMNEEFIFDDRYSTFVRIHSEQDGYKYLFSSGEMDDLWYEVIKLLYQENKFHLFLGKDETLYFFKIKFMKHSNTMLKTTKYIDENLINPNKKILVKQISKYFPEITNSVVHFKKIRSAILFYKRNGFWIFMHKNFDIIKNRLFRKQEK